MSDLLIFALIVVFAIVPFGIGIMYVLYRGTIVFTAASIVFGASMFTGIVSFAVSDFGLKSMYWAIPLCLVALVSVNAVFKKKIQKPLKEINNYLTLISKGVLNAQISDKILSANSEIGSVSQSLNTTLQGLHNTSNFATEISKSNFDLEYKLLSDEDEIGLALISMQKSLTDAYELEEKRKIEEKNTSYITNGIAKFSELLRLNNDNLEKLSINLLSNLVEYVGAAQAGMFVLNEENEEDIYYELTGAVAYNREKALDSKVKVGEGLIGRCIYEKLTITLTEVPENYVNISSGLGDANPRCILLVPAVIDDKVYAIIELASFKVFDKIITTFIEKVAENVASVISSVRNNERTSKLLAESESNSGEMAAQEEELRQNIEELKATQEEMLRKEGELKDMADKLELKEELLRQKMEELESNS